MNLRPPVMAKQCPDIGIILWGNVFFHYVVVLCPCQQFKLYKTCNAVIVYVSGVCLHESGIFLCVRGVSTACEWCVMTHQLATIQAQDTLKGAVISNILSSHNILTPGCPCTNLHT